MEEHLKNLNYEPKISVIIPVYNTDKYLKKCLDSVINQTLKDIEIICIDDGSTDSSLNILKKYAQNDSRIVLIIQENQGVSVARNAGINSAKSEYILFLDADDWLDKSTCEHTYNRITETDADIVCYGRYNVSNNQNKYHAANKYLQQYENDTNIPLHIIKHFIHNCWQKIFRLKFIKENNIFFPEGQKVFEDGIFNLNCLYNHPKYSFLNKALHYYLQDRPGSATSGNKNAIKNVIVADKYLLGSYEFKNCKTLNHKIMTIEKIIGDFVYFYNLKENESYRFIFCKEITEFKKWLYVNVDNSLLSQVPNIKTLNSYSCIKKMTDNMLQTIFSITNTPDKKHKILKLCGLKFSFRINKEIKEIQKRYKNHIKKLSSEIKHRKIRVLFYVTENSKWGYQTLYDALEQDKRFEPFLVVSLLYGVHQKKDKTRNNLEENYKFFKSRNMKVEYGYSEDAFVNLKEFLPDIIFYDQPWDIPKTHQPSETSKFALTCYCSYSISNNPIASQYNTQFYYNLWKYFLSHKLVKSEILQWMKYNKESLVISGHPKLDTYKDYEKYNSNKHYIIYAPHFSIKKSLLSFGTFDWNGHYILNFAKQHPEINWIFKPHPQLKTDFVKFGYMTEKEINDYFNEWNKIGLVYTQGDYFDLFKESDALITDCGSFLVEYLLTKKPVIHLISSNSKKHTIINEIASKNYYKTYNLQDLEKNLKEIIINKNDYLKNKRIKQINKIFNKNFKFNSAENIVKHLKKRIGG